MITISKTLIFPLLLASNLVSGSGLAADKPLQTGGNPIVLGIGFCDPHAVVYDDRVYVYATHDFSPENKGFVMKDWWVWSSSDLVNWKQESVLKPEDTYLKKSFNDCWATFGASKNGKYYWYFSAGQTNIGVVVADSPAGPWQDPLGKPLVANGLVPTMARDPDILMDDDGAAYMVFGTYDYYLVRLNDDMISLGEKPRLIELDRKVGPSGEGKTSDKPSLHKRNGIYYLSWSSFYATSKELYGPYTYRGTVLEEKNVAPEFKGNLYPDRHGNFFTWHNQWYYIFNDNSHPGSSKFFRDSCVAYLHYRDNGEMAPVRVDTIGVGQYDATQLKIQAEDFFALEKGEVRDGPDGGFEVRGLTEGSYLLYPNVKNLEKNASLSLQVAATAGGGVIEIRDHSSKGTLLGTCTVPDTGDQFKKMICTLDNAAGTKDICLVVKTKASEKMRLDWLSFEAQANR